MQRSTERILTTHAGSLPRPPELLALNQAKTRGEPYDEAARRALIPGAVAEAVRLQVESGVDIVNDGENGKTGWMNYAEERLGGFSTTDSFGALPPSERRDRKIFAEFYRDEIPQLPGPSVRAATEPITYTGHDLIAFDLANFKAALQGRQVVEAFLPAVAPGSFARGQNRYYKTEEEFLYALGEALSVEYKAITDAGYVLQLDDPGLPDTWDMINPEPSVEEYRKFAALRVEALNHALRDIPEDRIRYHICWGSWHGAHTTDLPLRDIVDVLLEVKAQAYSLEAGNVRHEHEWKVWRETKLPDGKILIPGVVSHATNVVEHPELVADRIVQYASLVGRENVIAGTDCGMSRVHRQLCWAKLRALAEGAALATAQLWGRSA